MRSNELAALRTRMDQIQARLVNDLQERARLVVEIARVKRRDGIPIVDSAREEQMLATALACAAEGFDRAALERILRAIFAESRALALES